MPEDLREVFEDTKNLAKTLISSGHISPANPPRLMQYSPDFVAKRPVEPNQELFLEVYDADTFEVARMLLQKKQKSPLVMNMANRFNPCGGAEDGAVAQEEALCRTSNLSDSLYDSSVALPATARHSRCLYGQRDENGQVVPSPIPHDSAYYTENVTVLKNRDYKPLNAADRFAVDVVTVAGHNLSALSRYGDGYRPNGTEEEKLHNLYVAGLRKATTENDYTFSELKNKFIEYTKLKIKLMLQIAATEKHESLVLGAISCGAFRLQFPKDDDRYKELREKTKTWTADSVAEAYKQAFIEAKNEGLLNNIKNIAFSTLKTTKEDINYEVFSKIADNLRNTLGAKKPTPSLYINQKFDPDVLLTKLIPQKKLLELSEEQSLKCNKIKDPTKTIDGKPIEWEIIAEVADKTDKKSETLMVGSGSSVYFTSTDPRKRIATTLGLLSSLSELATLAYKNSEFIYISARNYDPNEFETVLQKIFEINTNSNSTNKILVKFDNYLGNGIKQEQSNNINKLIEMHNNNVDLLLKDPNATNLQTPSANPNKKVHP